MSKLRVVFKKTHNWICVQCDVQFNWGKDCWAYGKLEYQMIHEREDIEKVFCSTKCKKLWIQNGSEKSKQVSKEETK